MLDGVVIIDKPSGPTSHDAVQRVKRIFGAAKAGHAGTLDPLATGVLVVCLGGATKRAGELMEGDKEYAVEMFFGMETATDDIEGEVISRADVPADLAERLSAAIPEFTGWIEQRPPCYSAVKYMGRPLYKWARQGKMIAAPLRRVEVKEFVLNDVDGEVVRARVTCSKGTYIRSLCRDLGRRVGCGACVNALRRTASGRFRIEDAVSLDFLESQNKSLQIPIHYVRETALC